jgi:spore germination protein YaaH
MKDEVAALKRIFAMLLLPLSVAPVLLLGPSLLRAPVTLAREIEGDIRHFNPFATDTAFAAAAHRGSTAGRLSSTSHGSGAHLTSKPHHGSGAHHTSKPHHRSAPLSCAQVRRRTKAFRAPGRVSGLRVLAHVSGGLRIGWHAVHGANPTLAGYRVRRDGAVLGQTRARSYVVKLSKTRAHTVSVVAVDVSGCVGPAGKPLRIKSHYVLQIPNNAGPSTPVGLSASEVSDAGATMWWLPSTPGGARIAGYRLYRDDGLVGQTPSTTMRLSHLSSLHTYLITVGTIDTAKHQSAPSAPFHLSTTHTAPDGPTQLAALKVTDTSATLAWNEGSATDGKLSGYLLFENGQPERVVSGLTTTVTLASERHYTFTVRALDAAGYLSAPAPELDVFTTHTPPPAPTGLTATEITASSATLKWSPSTAVSGKIVGYRVFRNDTPVGQTANPEMTLTSLAPSTGYQITVTAVDSLGAISPRTAPLQVQTENPTPTHGNVQAFLLASTDQSFDDLQAHYQQIGVVYPTDFNCGTGGKITGNNDPLVTGWAQARQIAVMPRLNCQNPTDEDEILNEPSKQETLINRLAELGSTYGYAGFQIDFEGAAPSERNPFTAFITALAARLHAQGEKLSTVVTAKYYNIMSGRAAMYDDAALSVPSDYLFVLDWGLHWTTSAPGALDELGWFTRVADYTATLPNKSKFVLGMPMYGIDWPNGGGASNPGTALEYDNVMTLASEYGITPEWEPTAADPHFSYVDSAGVSHSVWYTDQQSVAVRVALAQSLGLGVGLWHLGSEDQSIWELPGLGGSG